MPNMKTEADSLNIPNSQWKPDTLNIPILQSAEDKLRYLDHHQEDY
jgi:hypothetical protein